MRAVPYTAEHGTAWDELVDAAPMGTLLHTRRYLGYHGDRFTDRSLVIHDDSDRLVGVFPAAEDPDDAGTIVSHPGVTYGGIVHGGVLTGGLAEDALSAVKAALSGFERLIYKAVPIVYHQRPALDDRYALWAAGASLVRYDLSCAIDLANPGRRGSRRTRGVKRARREGVELREGVEQAERFWPVLIEVLEARHGVRPVHTLHEILDLHRRCGAAIRFVAAELDGTVIGGTVLFCTPSAHHAQYIAASDRGTEAGALDLLFDACIDRATTEQRRYFNFGVSTHPGGGLNRGLHAFKAEFGGAGVIHEIFELPLTR